MWDRFRRRESPLLQVARQQGELLGMMERMVTVMEQWAGPPASPPDSAGHSVDSSSGAGPCVYPAPCDCPGCVRLGREVPRVPPEALSGESTAPPTHASWPLDPPATPIFRAAPGYGCVPKPRLHHGPVEQDALGNQWCVVCDAFLGNVKIPVPAAEPTT